MKYYCRTQTDSWEEVTEYVFINRKYAVVPKDHVFVPRYTEEYISVVGNTVTFSGSVSIEELGKICRFLDIKVPTNSFTPILTTPFSVLIHKARSKTLHILETGENYTRKAA